MFPAERISVTGLLRTDNLMQPDCPYRAPPDPDAKTLTLFSFGHFAGGLGSPRRRSHYFSLEDDFGFVELFRDVHVAFAEAALAHPEVRFKIKPKNYEDWWIKEIEAVIEQGTGTALADIPNCEIVAEPAPELIQQSCAVVGFNSTVLLESSILGRNSIFPVFAEAIEPYPDYVYFPNFRDVFAVASSKADLRGKLDAAVAGETLSTAPPQRLGELCTFSLGQAEAGSAERVVAVLADLAAGRNPASRERLEHAA